MTSVLSKVNEIVAPIPWFTFVLGFSVADLYFIAGPAAEGLVFDRVAISNGEYYRLITAHFIHCDIEHLAWNLVAFIILGSIIEYHSIKLLLLTITTGIIGVDIWLLYGSSLVYYCGLSGVLNGLLAMGVFLLWKDTKHPMLLVVSIAAVAKLIIEMLTHDSIVTNILWAPVPEAHAAGLIAVIILLGFQNLNETVIAPNWSAESCPLYSCERKTWVYAMRALL